MPYSSNKTVVYKEKPERWDFFSMEMIIKNEGKIIEIEGKKENGNTNHRKEATDADYGAHSYCVVNEHNEM